MKECLYERQKNDAQWVEWGENETKRAESLTSGGVFRHWKAAATTSTSRAERVVLGAMLELIDDVVVEDVVSGLLARRMVEQGWKKDGQEELEEKDGREEKSRKWRFQLTSESVGLRRSSESSISQGHVRNFAPIERHSGLVVKRVTRWNMLFELLSLGLSMTWRTLCNSIAVRARHQNLERGCQWFCDYTNAQYFRDGEGCPSKRVPLHTLTGTDNNTNNTLHCYSIVRETSPRRGVSSHFGSCRKWSTSSIERCE